MALQDQRLGMAATGLETGERVRLDQATLDPPPDRKVALAERGRSSPGFDWSPTLSAA